MNSSTKPAWLSKKFLTNAISITASMLAFILSTISIEPTDSTQTIAVKIFGAVAQAIIIQLASTGYINHQSEIDLASIKENAKPLIQDFMIKGK